MEHLYVPVTGFCMERSRVDSAGEMAYFHYHNAYEIYFLVSGTRNYIINDKLFSLQEGDVVLVPPQALHKTTGCGYERILISFDRSYLEQNFVPDKADLLLKGFAPQMIRIPANRMVQVKLLLERLWNEQKKQNNRFSFLYLGELLATLQTCAANTEPSGKISDILEYINQNYRTIEGIDQVAQRFYLSRYYLCRFFKQYTGLSIMEYLNHIKIKNACIQITANRGSLTRICFDCGFHSYSNFCNTFKKITGYSPMQFKKRNQS